MNTYLCCICYQEVLENDCILHEKRYFCSKKCKYHDLFNLEEYDKNKICDLKINNDEYCINGTCGGGKYWCTNCEIEFDNFPWFYYRIDYVYDYKNDKKTSEVENTYITLYDNIHGNYFKFIKDKDLTLNFEEFKQICSKDCMTEKDWKEWDAIVKYHEIYLNSFF